MITSHPLLFGLLMLAGAGAVLFVFYKLLMTSIARPQPQTATRATAEEMAQLEQSLGGPLPQQLRDAYLDGSILSFSLPLVLARPKLEELEGDTGEDCVAEFFAANAASNRISIEDAEFPETAFVFARDDVGNLFYIRSDAAGVYFWEHDGDGDGTVRYRMFKDFWHALATARPISPER